MADPHRKDRYGEMWDSAHVAACEADLREVRDFVIVSGGWAWHFLSPAGHAELKHAHDHKDVDVFADPARAGELAAQLASMGYHRVVTRFDKRPAPYPFRRLERRVGDHVVVIDLFTGSVPNRTVRGGFRVVEPGYLISLYKTVHGSDTCFAVRAAARLLERGIDPEGRPELAEVPRD